MSEELKSASGRKLPEVIGGYKVIARLSRGGMGEVLLGQKEAHGFQKKVAIKVVLPHVAEDEEFRTLFFDEARLMARMSHSHIAQVFDFGIDDGHLFMVMEFVDGLSVERLFAEHQQRGSRMPPELAGLAIAQAARGLHSAHVLTDDDGHPLNVVHRDVSPQNLIITWNGSAKVLDFGIARSSVRRGQTQIGVVRGKPGYMAPEQARNQPLDARTDIFQLGIVLFELLAGRELYVRDNMYEAIAAAVEEPVPDITAEVPGIDAGYGDVLSAALAKSPDERFRTADAMARALDAVVSRAGYPVSEASLSDHLKTLRPKPSSTEAVTAPALTPAAQTESGRATGMSTMELEDPGAAAASAASALEQASAQVTETAPTDSEPPRPAVETGQPVVKTFSARETLSSPVDGPDTGTARIEHEQRQRVMLVFALGLALLLVVGGVVWFGGQGEQPGLVDPTPSAAVVDAGRLVAADPATATTAAIDAGAPPTVAVAADRAPVEERAKRRRRRRSPGTMDKTPAPEPEVATAPEPEAVPAPVPPTTTPTSAETGTIFVVSEPYAHIFVDGQRKGDTPKMLKLEAGTHALKLVDPQSGAAWLSRDVLVKRGRNPPLKAKRP